MFFESLPPTLLIPFSADPSLPCCYLGRCIARCEARTEPPSLFVYLLIPAAAANPTAKRDHPFANETRYRHYNQDFINDDNSTIGRPGAPLGPGQRPALALDLSHTLWRKRSALWPKRSGRPSRIFETTGNNSQAPAPRARAPPHTPPVRDQTFSGVSNRFSMTLSTRPNSRAPSAVKNWSRSKASSIFLIACPVCFT